MLFVFFAFRYLAVKMRSRVRARLPTSIAGRYGGAAGSHFTPIFVRRAAILQTRQNACRMRPQTGNRMIEIIDISKTYANGAAPSVAGLSLTVMDREFLVLIGPSGCGKTTTLNMINRLIEPGSGTIRIDGHDIRSDDPVSLRRPDRLCFSGGRPFSPYECGRYIAVTPRLLGWKPAEIAARVADLMALVRLEGLQDRLPRELSGGSASASLWPAPWPPGQDHVARRALSAPSIRLHATRSPTITAAFTTAWTSPP